MQEIKIQQNFSASYRSVSFNSENSASNFKSLLTENLSALPADFENYTCKKFFAPDINFNFPPANAPDYFKNAWYDVASQLEDFSNFSGEIATSIQYGYYFSMTEQTAFQGYNAMQTRVETLGAVGCLQLSIRATEDFYTNNLDTEQNFIDTIKTSLNAMQEILQKCLESGDSQIEQQIKLADIDFQTAKANILQQRELYLKSQDENDWRTMSDEKFEKVIDSVQPTFTKFLPDGTVITIDSATGKVLDITKPSPLENILI